MTQTRRDKDLDKELALHLELEAEDARDRGLSDGAARDAARRAFGSVLKTKEETRAMWSGMWLERLWQDVRFGVRGLRRAPAFTVVAVLTLAIGIGANTAIFSIVDAVVLRPLAYKDASRLVAIHETFVAPQRSATVVPVNVAHFQSWRAGSRAFENVALLQSQDMNLTGTGDPRTIHVARASASILSVVGAQPRLGRMFNADEDRRGNDHVVILGDGIWRDRFASDPLIVGRSISLDDEPYEVVGVLPSDFRMPPIDGLYPTPVTGGPSPEMWKPLGARDSELDPSSEFSFACIGRLRPGVSISQAADDVRGVQHQISTTLASRTLLDVVIVPLQEQVTGRSRAGLQLLLAAVGAVLLIGCVNITSLLFARTVARRREIALRSALGASRQALVQHILIEGLLLAVVGGALALSLAAVGTELIVAFAPAGIPRLDEVHLDARALLFAVGLSGAAGLLVGAIPMWRLTRADPREAAQACTARTTPGRAALALRSLLIVLEVGLTVTCLLAGGLLLRSFAKVLSSERGFNVEHVLTVGINLPLTRYPTPDDRAAFIKSALDQIQATPGVTSVTVSNRLPLTGGGYRGVVSVEGVTTPPAQRPIVDYRVVSPAYFETLSIPIRSGRPFSESDRSHPVAVVSELAATRIWPGENAIGKRFTSAPINRTFIEVVGVAADVRASGLDKDPALTVYMPYWQATPPRIQVAMSLAVRTIASPQSATSFVRDAIRRLDGGLPPPAFTTMDDLVSASVSERRFQMELVLLFAAAGLLLASIGIYGVVSYSVSQRTNEIGIRMALGARPWQIRRLILRQGLTPVSAGLVVGLLGSLAAARTLSGLLYGVSVLDPITIAGVTAVLATVAMIANYLPARRATRVDPLRALRAE